MRPARIVKTVLTGAQLFLAAAIMAALYIAMVIIPIAGFAYWRGFMLPIGAMEQLVLFAAFWCLTIYIFWKLMVAS